MKTLHKTSIIMGMILFIGCTSIALAIIPKPTIPSKEVTIRQTAESKPIPAAIPAKQTAAEVPQPIVTPNPKSASTPEQVKTESLNKITNYAVSRGWNTEVQKHCADIHYNSFIDHVDELFITGINVRSLASGNRHYDHTPISSDEQGIARIHYDGACDILYQVDPS